MTIQREVERLDSKLMILASIGSAGPYIGLFGTVIGIMNSFTSIAASSNTSLAVVAPGIAEALFATAIGLFAPSGTYRHSPGCRPHLLFFPLLFIFHDYRTGKVKTWRDDHYLKLPAVTLYACKMMADALIDNPGWGRLL